MQNLTFYLFLAILLTTCASNDPPKSEISAWEERIAGIKSTYAPDRRTDRVEVVAERRGDSLVLDGYTTVPAALKQLESLAANLPDTYNRVRLLGQQDSFGLIRVSVANIRTEPGHSQELTSQALLGTPVELLDYDHGWYLIRTPDRYLAWLETGAIQPADRATLAGWFTDDLRTCVPAQSAVMSAPDSRSIVSELVAGNLLQVTGNEQGGALEVRLPDGRTGWVPTSDLAPYTALATPDAVRIESVLSTAFEQVGRPYLWGGTSPKAMDCSGFTKTAYYLNGYVIPRDASQQVHSGTDVPLDDDFSALQRGDLLFFGNYRDDGSERVTHVGFYLGEGRFLHAGADNGYITENSLREGEKDYAEHRRNSLLRARRLREGSPGVVPVAEAFRDVYTRSSSR
ncbi:C40 family peptidase [Neolewinella litorea]|uniref:Glycoside hydrolase n=1 Tax=Neolewinella litorea TaxID=2562452 RepID=A0A4S4NQE9_9BACT|nr:NlpC/P60 family protein [Neolewinella litorea]THH40568.1 glycoside hydrolase [Neolewinella litorea]